LSIRLTKGIENYSRNSERSSIVTIGTFDGIHLGHQEILRRVMIAREDSGNESILVTFHPHPRMLVTPDNVPLLLTTIEEKEQFIPNFFEGDVLVLDFNTKLQNMSAERFVKEILLDKLKMKKLIVGYDHAFGKNRGGSIVQLNELGAELDFKVEVVGPVLYEGQRISSSQIRRAMTDGRFDDVLKYLGHPYAIYGTVEKGIGLGKKLGYPTANIKYNTRKLLPAQGVYACRALVDDTRYNGMMFIGTNHFNPQKQISVEANLFDFQSDIYGKDIHVCPTSFIRENRRFDSTDALVRQIEKDKKEVLKINEMEKTNANS